MSSIDANTLSDPVRVRRTELALRHANAERALAIGQERQDKKIIDDARSALAAVMTEIEAEYKDEEVKGK
jgi:hypothetical protein